MKSLGLIVLLFWTSAIFAEVCSQKTAEFILAEADSKNHTVNVNCSLTVPRGKKITKRLVFEGSSASNVVFDCNGATIDPLNKGGYTVSIKSKKLSADSWDPPRNVTVKNCTIYGDIRVYGIGTNGQGEDLKPLSYKADYTQVTQKFAPRNIFLDRLKIIADGGTPVYISPGSTYVTLSNSDLSGHAVSVAVYLDAESAHNTIRNNVLHVDTGDREQLAVDGSAHNLIVGNRFSHLHLGGIYLYRNCGEGGVIRHQPPERNKIINNIFYYKDYYGNNPAVNVASRNGGRRYCTYDKGYPYGSSASDKDFARDNIIAQNQFVNRDPDDYISFKDRPNWSIENFKVKSEFKQPSGCAFIFNDVPQFVNHGAYAAVYNSNGEGSKYWCNDGEVSKVEKVLTEEIDFVCKVTGNNRGCEKLVNCPRGKKLVAAKALCDLEFGGVDEWRVNGAQWNTLTVTQKSDNTDEGSCKFFSTYIRTGSTSIANFMQGQFAFYIACKEHDKNGGDCEIRGKAQCL